MLSNLLKDFLQFPDIKEVIENPAKYPFIDEKFVKKWEEMMTVVLADGIKGEIIKNLSIRTYDPFSDGVASEVVGKAKFEVSCVVKAGQEDIKKQNDFMRSYVDMGFFPTILNEAHHDGKWICLMENLAGYDSLHEYIFKTKAESKKEIENFINYYYIWLQEIYTRYKSPKKPDLNGIYIQPRLIQRIEGAVKKFKQSGKHILTLDIDSLLASRINIDGVKLLSFNELMKTINSKIANIQNLSPDFCTFVHGDCHPANIMLFIQQPHYRIKLIDPNPSLGGISDYIYDQGKMFHWLDMMGYVVLERTEGEPLVTIDHKIENGQLHVKYNWSDQTKINLCKIKEFQAHAYSCAMTSLSLLADKLNDKSWRNRLSLSIAAAYLGGLSRLERPEHEAILYLQGLKFLNLFVKENLS